MSNEVQAVIRAANGLARSLEVEINDLRDMLDKERVQHRIIIKAADFRERDYLALLERCVEWLKLTRVTQGIDGAGSRLIDDMVNVTGTRKT